MGVEHECCARLLVLRKLEPMAVVQDNGRLAVFFDKAARLCGHGYDDPVGLLVVDEHVLGVAILVFLADQHGHAVDNVDEDVVLEHDCRNGIAQLELHFLVDTETERQQKDRIDHQECGEKHPQRDWRAGELDSASAAGLRDEQFPVYQCPVKHPHNGDKHADRYRDGQPQRNDRDRHQQEIRYRCPAVDHQFKDADGLEQPHDPDKRQHHREGCSQHLSEDVPVKLHVRPL